MPNPNQRNIPVSRNEGELLELAKKSYEDGHGKADWGNFLGYLAAGFLVSAGIVAIAKGIENSREKSFEVECPYEDCKKITRVVVKGKPSVAETLFCPWCNRQFVIKYEI